MPKKYRNYYGLEPSAVNMNPVPSPDVLRLIFRLREQRDDPAVKQLIKVSKVSEDVLDMSPSEFAQRLRSNEDNNLFTFNLLLEFVCSRSRMNRHIADASAKYSNKVRLLMRYFASSQTEQIVFMPADTRKRKPDIIVIGMGAPLSVAANLRELVKQVSLIGSHRILLAHNHPDSSSEPSESDVIATIELRNSLSIYSIALEDHMIFGCNAPFSMRSDRRYSYIFKEDIRTKQGPPAPEELNE